MKQKIFFVLAALMMLTGTSAMAQSETLKGDVNGDGAVDVADIAAEIKVLANNGSTATKFYYYIGMEKITANNYMTFAEARTTRLPAREYTGEKLGKWYILVPDIVTSIKLKDFNAGVYVNGYSQDTTFNVPGCKLWVTSATGANAPVIVEYYYE